MKVVIAGGTGQIGQMLKREYLKRGYEVVVLTRSPLQPEEVHWDAETLGPWAAELEGADWLINLAGRTVNCRYTEANMKQMMDSRIKSTELLGKAVEQCQNPPAMWFQMSTATIYAHSFDKANDEFSGTIGGNEPGAPEYWNYSVEIGQNWEKTLNDANSPKTHKVALRAAMVMSPDKGGVFKELSRIAILGLGGSIAGGKQYMSWIHEMDFVRALDFIAENNIEGPVNLSSPTPLTQKEFMRTLRKEMGQPIGLPATKWMAEIGAFFLRTDTELVLKSRRVIPGKLTKAGFEFGYETWPKAASELANRSGNKLAMHFCLFAWAAYLFTLALFATLIGGDYGFSPGFGFAEKIFMATVGFFLIAIFIVRRSIGKLIYRRQTRGKTYFWSYVGAIAVVFLTFGLAELTDGIIDIWNGKKTYLTYQKVIMKSLVYPLFAVLYSAPGIAIFGTFMAYDANNKLENNPAYQR